jgi:phage host-nuclease inhibitor protein Gam
MWLLDDDERDRQSAADDYLEGVQVPAPNIDCAALAERHLYQVRLIRRELDGIEAQATAMHERVTAWAKRRRARLERREAWHKGGLMAYMVWCGKKTLEMVNGTLRVVAGRERIEVLDLEAFLAAAPERFVRTLREPDKTALKAHLRATGELLPGTDVVRGDDHLSCAFDDRTD